MLGVKKRQTLGKVAEHYQSNQGPPSAVELLLFVMMMVNKWQNHEREKHHQM
jgi:hypothetical protein